MKLIRNVSYTLLSNMLSIIVSTLIVLVVPKFIGVHEYGLWQLFVFYESYVGMLHLGWADGLFLRRGGQHASKIDVGSLRAETILFIAFNALVGIVPIVYGVLFATHFQFIIISVGIAILIANTRTWVTMILQAIGNFKGYAINLSAQSLVYLVLIAVILIFNLADYRFMIVAFLLSQLTTSLSGFVQLTQLFKRQKRILKFKDAFREAKLNVTSGFKLMIANSTAMLIIGVIRFGIQRKWSVDVFGKVSLVLSIANLIMIFINAISLVLFPTLRRTKQVVDSLYVGIRNVLMPFLYLTMILYFPLRFIIPLWLPQYADMMKFATILMPMMVYQGKFEILSNTFMKNFRMEATLMFINVTTLVLSVVLTGLTVYVVHNISLAIFSIAFVMGFRSVVAEIILSRRIGVKFVSEVIFENVFILGFMLISWNLPLLMSLGIYLVTIFGYLTYKRRDFMRGITILKELSKY